jgi:hypothetical protein
MIRGPNLSTIRNYLSSFVRKRHCNLTEDTGVLIEWYLESLGWPDFLVSLWGPNAEMIIKAIEMLRQNCQANTTTILGVTPEETTMRLDEMSRKATETANKKAASSKAAYVDTIFTEYIAWQKAFLKNMEKDLEKEVEAKQL